MRVALCTAAMQTAQTHERQTQTAEHTAVTCQACGTSREDFMADVWWWLQHATPAEVLAGYTCPKECC